MTAPAMTSAAQAPSTGVSAPRIFARTCAAEWTRLWTVKATWWFAAVAAVVMVGFGTLIGFEAGADAGAQGDPAWAVARFAAMPTQFALLALALMSVTADYATGGIVPTLQWTPRRGVLFLARVVVTVAAATGLGAVLSVVAGLAAFAAGRPGLTLPWGQGLEAVGTVAFVVAAGTALAAGLGFLLRNTAGALVTVFLLMLVLPLMLPQFGVAWLDTLGDALPGSGAAFLLLGEVPGMTRMSSVLVMLAWAGGVLLLGWLRLLRADANR